MTEQYAKQVMPATNEQLAEVSALLEQLFQHQARVAQLQAQLKEETSQVQRLEESTLPDLLTTLGFNELTTNDGNCVEIKEQLYASIPKKNKVKAAQWLTDHGQDVLISREVSVGFGPEDDDRISALTEALDQMGLTTYSVTQDMNTGSVKSVLTELIEQGVDVPMKLFGAFKKRWVIVK